MAPDTGFPSSDAQDDFLRVRRQYVLRRLSRGLGGGDIDVILPFDEVIAELGRVGERDAGLQVVPLEMIVGTVGRARDFDRAFRPTSRQVRGRWERLAIAMRRGESVPPISLYRVDDMFFVRDGHHRVSVARALGRRDIEAYVVEVQTRVDAERTMRLSDLPLKGHERLFRERVPLAPEAAARVRLSDPAKYGELAESVEAWGFRAIQDRGEELDRHATATAWFEEEFVPVVEMLREAKLMRKGETDADAYARLGGVRYQLWRTMDWSEDVVERLRQELGG